jgi:hypothetical protein
MFSDIIAVNSENDSKHVNALYVKNAELLNVKAGDEFQVVTAG